MSDNLIVSPHSLILGPGLDGGTLTGNLTLSDQATPPSSGITVTSIVMAAGSDPAYVLSGFSNGTIVSGAPQTVTVSISKAVAGTYTGTIQINYLFVFRGNTYPESYNIPVSAQFVAATAGLTVSPSLITFPVDLVNVTDYLTLNITNQSGLSINITGLTFSDPSGFGVNFSILSGPVNTTSTTAVPVAASQAVVVNSGVNIVLGQSITYDVGGVNQEVVVVTALSYIAGLVTGFTATFAKTHLANVNITAAAGQAVPTLPAAVAGGATVTIPIAFNHATLGVIATTLAIANNGLTSPVNVSITGSTVPMFSFNPLVGAGLTLVLGPTKSVDGNNTHLFYASSIPGNSSFDSVLEFNNPLWDMPGQEKTLIRLEVFYENFGVCNLSLLLQSFRQALNNGAGGIDQQSASIQIGDLTADQSDRSTFFDCEISGEIILATITRPANGGTCSLTGFTPHFADRGEKVENA